MQRRREEREEEEARQRETDAAPLPTERTAPEPPRQPETRPLSSSEIRNQTRALLRWALVILGAGLLYAIWIDVLPALGILGRFSLWGAPVEQGGGGVTTLADLLLSIGV